MNVVVDTPVLLDMALESRPRHGQARVLGEYLIAHDIGVTIPMTAFFELHAAARNEHMEGRSGKFVFPSEEHPLLVDAVPIDEAFVTTYLDDTLPYVRAGDLLFLSIAAHDKLALVTEDRTLHARATEGGIEAFTIDEFTERHSS